MTETTAFAAYPPLTDIVDIAIDEMLRSVAVPTEEEDRDLAEQALIAIARNYLYRQAQLWAVGLCEESGAQQGPQLDCPISQENICAEIVTLLRAGGRRLRKVAVGHKKTNAEGGQVHNVVMCEGCRSRYLTHIRPPTIRTSAGLRCQ
jgi:DNA-directed RNA polymerase subunit RPC12/RpoP